MAAPAVPYGSGDFHHCGRIGNDDIVNWSDRWEVQNCELVDPADLATESGHVRGELTGYHRNRCSDRVPPGGVVGAAFPGGRMSGLPNLAGLDAARFGRRRHLHRQPRLAAERAGQH